ncbi:DNA-dependent RNA polymerase subunit epsilon [Salinicoccus sp. HZC-1]|uniref:DNA-dependent RNA polymerase subunit epsilon n=1 Tax=Salinicoccus sp. HZC-1 TaxID=3385497 RepID=UPI00398B001D
MAVFKVFFQETLDYRIIREDTHTRYFEAESETDVRLGLKDESYNIEFVQELSPEHLEYEKENNSDFKVENF